MKIQKIQKCNKKVEREKEKTKKKKHIESNRIRIQKVKNWTQKSFQRQHLSTKSKQTKNRGQEGPEKRGNHS